MPFELPEELERYISTAVENGDFASREELVSDALRLHRERAERLRTLRAEVQKGIDELDRGDAYEIRGDEELRAFFNEIDREGKEMLKKETLEGRAAS